MTTINLSGIVPSNSGGVTVTLDNTSQHTVASVPDPTIDITVDPSSDVSITGTDSELIVTTPTTVNQNSLSGMNDVDLTDLVDNAVLMYDSQVARWKPSRTFDDHFVDCGQY